MKKLYERFINLISELDFEFVRYIYTDINWNNRLIGITGARGVGKTTLILQHIKKHLDPKSAIYVTVEDFYFSTNKLIDLANEFVKMGGKHLFIDEIHKYRDWSQELKLIYDYHPNLQVVFTGSSVLDINKGAFDLSRRAVMYELYGLSFREYLNIFHQIEIPVYSLDNLINHTVSLSVLKRPLPLFKEYLQRGYYPFAKEDEFDIRLMQIVNLTLESDIPQYADMNVSTGRKLKQLLAIISQNVPFKPNFSSIATMLGASRNNIADYLMYMEDAKLIAQVRSFTGGIRGLGKVDKIFLDNTNLMYILADTEVNIGNIRETFFFNQTKVKYDVIQSPIADFLINDMTFEVGGKKKNQTQLNNIDKGFIVKDDIEYGFMNIIPLWQFGLLY